MDNKKMGSFLNQFPEWYYDFIVYIIPSLLFYSILYYSNFALHPEINKFISHGNTTIQIWIFFLIAGVFYITGQLITFLSYWLIWFCPKILFKRVFLWYKDEGWYKKFAEIKFANETVARELNKRYARANIARNNCLVCLIIIIVPTAIPKMYSLVLFILFFFEAHVRKKWLLEIVDTYYRKLPKPDEA